LHELIKLSSILQLSSIYARYILLISQVNKLQN
jgi:hypothetical protein